MTTQPNHKTPSFWELIAGVCLPGELEGIKQFQTNLVTEIENGRPVVIYFDNDGTTFPLVPRPRDVEMDRGCYEGLVRLSQYPNVTAISLTGRDVHTAKLMLTPAYGDGNLHFAIIGSHGVEKLGPGNDTPERYDFDKDFGARAISDFVNELKREAAALRETYPGIHVEDEKHGTVAINVATIADETLHEAAHESVSHLMRKFANSPDNPIINLKTGERLFQIRGESKNELELRPIGYGKDFGIKYFGKKFEDKNIKPMTALFCDSLGPDGTDRPAAEFVKTLPNGHVVWVSNGNNEVSDIADVVFSSPALLGAFLMDTAAALEAGPAIPANRCQSPRRLREPERTA